MMFRRRPGRCHMLRCRADSGQLANSSAGTPLPEPMAEWAHARCTRTVRWDYRRRRAQDRGTLDPPHAGTVIVPVRVRWQAVSHDVATGVQWPSVVRWVT